MTGSGDGEDASREEVSALLVEVEAVERVERPFFGGGCSVVPGEWRLRLVKARGSSAPVGVMEASVGRFLDGSLGATESPADLATMLAQEVGGGMEESRGAREEARREWLRFRICERSFAGERCPECDRGDPSAKNWVGLAGASDALVERKGAARLQRREASRRRMDVGRE